ncbi:MAG: S41 family peptidase [Candidatus Saccharibacteria bacterium]|nr:S41 family peptidase [Candidatus Saccharibacteria bacterium]
MLINDKKQSNNIVKYYGVLLVGLLIFGAGWSLGSGKINLIQQNASVQTNAPNNLDYSSVEQIYDELRQNFDGKLDNAKLLDGLKTGLVAASGDPYTEYMPPEKANDFKGQLSGTFEGIGALLGKNDKGNVIVISPIDGFPAKKAGLQPRDVIAEIDGKDASTLAVDKAVEKIRGPKGTKVKLRIIRDEKEDLTFEITREEINIPSVESKVLDSGIGYIKISRFGDDTAELSRTAAEKFKNDGVSKVILDLRGNPGGYLEAAVDVSSLWLNNKTVLQEKRDGKIIKTYSSRGTAPLEGIQTTVLIDEGSASASEITAGALHDNKAATLLGVKSFGKGSVQEPQTLKNGGLLKITVARWYTPNGKNIDKEGIQPDQKVERSEDDYKAGRDPQLDAAITKLQ